MRIAVDARELNGKPTGVGRYLAAILGAWSDLPGAAAHDVVLCAPARVALPGAERLRATWLTAPGTGTAWEQLVLPRLVRQAAADVLFAPGYSGPLRGPVPMVLTIHDVSFAAHPEWFSWREGTRRRWVTRLAARKAVRIVTVSDFSKREIVRHLDVDHAKVDVIYSGAPSPPNTPGPRATWPPAGARYILYVGSIFNRRHVPELIEAYSLVAERHPHVRLELVGDNRTTPHVDLDALIARSPARERIRARAYLTDPEVGALYDAAAAFAFLSDYEGFGLTPLEAMAAGVPIVVLDTPVAREIYGPAAIYVDQPTPPAVAAALETALFDEPERGRLASAAEAVLARYVWSECAHRTLQVLLACASRPS